MRNIATRYDEPRQSPPPRRASVPAVAFSPPNTIPSTPGGEEEEEAVAGRLEIRVVDATGGATVVQTTADREPLQSKYRNALIYYIFTRPRKFSKILLLCCHRSAVVVVAGGDMFLLWLLSYHIICRYYLRDFTFI